MIERETDRRTLLSVRRENEMSEAVLDPTAVHEASIEEKQLPD